MAVVKTLIVNCASGDPGASPALGERPRRSPGRLTAIHSVRTPIRSYKRFTIALACNSAWRGTRE
jgi:hypothetical protein